MGFNRTFFRDGEGKFRIHSYYKAVIYDVLTVKVFQHVNVLAVSDLFLLVTFTEFLGEFSTFLLKNLLSRHY